MNTSLDSTAKFAELIEQKGGPDWYRSQAKQALSDAKYPTLPAADHESWRKIDLTGLDLRDFNPGESKTSLVVEGLANTDTGIVWGEPADLAATDDIAAATIKELGESRLNTANYNGSNNNIFSRLGQALPGQTIYIRGKKPRKEPVYLKHTLDEGNTLNHRTILEVEAGSELTVVEMVTAAPREDFSFWNLIGDAKVADGARLNYIALFNFTDSEYHFANFNVELGRDARAHFSTVNIGGFRGKSFYTARMFGQGSEFRGIGLVAASGREYMDMEQLVEHHASHTDSNLHYKAVLNNRAHSIFNGNLFIKPGVKHANSYQLNNNILLSKKARAESMPNLVIKAEDVGAEHGATVGELDSDSVFYLMSRGIPEMQARHLLIEGFITEIIGEIPLADKEDEILMAIKEKIQL